MDVLAEKNSKPDIVTRQYNSGTRISNVKKIPHEVIFPGGRGT
jgi:hypothetical protein